MISRHASHHPAAFWLPATMTSRAEVDLKTSHSAQDLLGKNGQNPEGASVLLFRLCVRYNEDYICLLLLATNWANFQYRSSCYRMITLYTDNTPVFVSSYDTYGGQRRKTQESEADTKKSHHLYFTKTNRTRSGFRFSHHSVHPVEQVWLLRCWYKTCTEQVSTSCY